MIKALIYAQRRQTSFEQTLVDWGKKSKTTFMLDFTIADAFGIKAIYDTYNRAFREWKGNVEYMSELVMVLNHKIWDYYENHPTLGKVYDELWRKASEYCQTHFKGNELSYYYNFVD